MAVFKGEADKSRPAKQFSRYDALLCVVMTQTEDIIAKVKNSRALECGEYQAVAHLELLQRGNDGNCGILLPLLWRHHHVHLDHDRQNHPNPFTLESNLPFSL